MIEAADISVILPFLEELGGWPLLENKQGGKWRESNFNLTTLLVELARLNNMPLINFYVSTDQKNSSQRVLHVSYAFAHWPKAFTNHNE